MSLRDAIQQYIESIESDFLVSFFEYASNQKVAEDLTNILKLTSDEE